jgi:stage V sporulation protein R
MGLAYEIVINSNPCIAYLMEENTLTMQALVIAHAAYGHNSFFKGNYLFRLDQRRRDHRLPGVRPQLHRRVRASATASTRWSMLDSCHALMNVGVDRYKRPQKLSLAKETARQQEREEYLQSQVNDLWRTLPQRPAAPEQASRGALPARARGEPALFHRENAPLLEPWQREVVRIVRKIGQYFYPQRQTKVMNEGWATFWHYTLLNRLYDEGKLVRRLHARVPAVAHQRRLPAALQQPWYSGINPYALGFAMWRDIRRICEQPDDEDRAWFPDIAGQRLARRPRLRDAQLQGRELHRAVPVAAADARTSACSRCWTTTLAEQYNLANSDPDIQVWSVNTRGDRSLTLRHFMHRNRPLGDTADEMLRHVARLWGFDVYLESINGDGGIAHQHACHIEKRHGR